MGAGAVEELAELALDVVIAAAGAEQLVEDEEEAGLVLDHVVEAGDEDVEHVIRRARFPQRVVEPGDADLGVAADDLDQQPLLGAEVVVEEAPADLRLGGDLLEGRARGAAFGDALAHRVDDALGLLSAELALLGRLQAMRR